MVKGPCMSKTLGSPRSAVTPLCVWFMINDLPLNKYFLFFVLCVKVSIGV